MTVTEYLLTPVKDETGNPEHDLLLAMMRGIEDRDGEQAGWHDDPNPALFIAQLLRTDGRAGVIQAERVPIKQWLTSRDTAAALQLLSWAYPIPDRDARRVEYADSPGGAAAVIYMAEAWALIGDDATAEKTGRAVAGERFISKDPARTEVRFIGAADINGDGFMLVRKRGDVEPTRTESWKRDDMFARAVAGGPGRILPALYRLANAARLGKFVAKN